MASHKKTMANHEKNSSDKDLLGETKESPKLAFTQPQLEMIERGDIIQEMSEELQGDEMVEFD